MDMRDYEKQEELRRGNELTAENNQTPEKAVRAAGKTELRIVVSA